MSPRNLLRSLTLPMFCALLWGALPPGVCAEPAVPTSPPVPEARPDPEPPEEVPPTRVAICHRDPGASGATRATTIRVPSPALREHLEHGDTLGTCAP